MTPPVWFELAQMRIHSFARYVIQIVRSYLAIHKIDDAMYYCAQLGTNP